MFIAMFISKEYVEKYGKKQQKNSLSYQLTHVNSSLLFFAAKSRLKENMHLNIF